MDKNVKVINVRWTWILIFFLFGFGFQLGVEIMSALSKLIFGG